MDELATLQTLGITLPSPAYIAGSLLFGLVGFAAWRHGRRTGHAPRKWLGVALMVYPYLVPGTLSLYLVGTALCLALTQDWQ